MINMKLFKVFLALLITGALASCENMLDNIRPYLDKGETIYVGRADSLYTNDGLNRIELVVRLKGGFSQSSCRVVRTNQDGESDTLMYEIERTNGEQYLSYMYTQLDEGQYDFSVVLFDELGNSSLEEVVGGYSYGEFYKSTLLNRSFHVQNEDGKVVFQWKSIDSALYTLLTYETNEGNEKTIEVPADVFVTEITDFKEGGVYSWKTAYKPSDTALDIFFSNIETGNFSF